MIIEQIGCFLSNEYKWVFIHLHTYYVHYFYSLFFFLSVLIFVWRAVETQLKSGVGDTNNAIFNGIESECQPRWLTPFDVLSLKQSPPFLPLVFFFKVKHSNVDLSVMRLCSLISQRHIVHNINSVCDECMQSTLTCVPYVLCCFFFTSPVQIIV